MPVSSSTSATRTISKSSEPALPASPTQTEQAEEFSHSECILRLEADGVGRVAAILDCRPYICPVNYVLHEGAIVFRTRRGSHLHMATHDSYAALEIDRADFMYHEGWSVLVQGRSSHIVDPAEVIALARVCVAPWAGDAMDSFVQIRLDEVHGERIIHRPPDPTPRPTPDLARKTAYSETVPNSSKRNARGVR
jgi:uncharacterized protein